MYTVIWKNFVPNFFVCKNVVLKYFCGLWQPTKCILCTNVCAFNFRGLLAPRKYFNDEHFPIYGMYFFPSNSVEVTIFCVFLLEGFRTRL